MGKKGNKIHWKALSKSFFACVIGLMILLSVCSPAFASAQSVETVESDNEYKPLDLVLVIDGSGSMKYSDTDQTALAAASMVVNMMPAEDSRIGIISFNTQPTVHTQNESGNDGLIALAEFTGVETVKSDIDEIEYSGDTGIGNALDAAVELLEDNYDPERSQAIIVFSDGVDDFGVDSLSLARCEENEAAAVQRAKSCGIPIYCVAYDYAMEDGTSSLGDDGLAKLENIADTTGGLCRVIQTTDEIEDLFIEFLADVCDVVYQHIETIPGDGGMYTCTIPITSSVMEANIRIPNVSQEAVDAGCIRLQDPDGNEIQLINSGNVRFAIDANAANIKVMRPEYGNWTLILNGITGEDINIGLLEHYKMNLTSELSVPAGNPAGVAYSGDTVTLKTWLEYKGVALDDDMIYDTVQTAEATVVSRADPDHPISVTLTRDGRSFVGGFTVDEDSYYDITIRLDWESFYREDHMTVMSSNKPLELVGNIGDVSVNKNKTVDIPDIFQYVADEENDPITAEITSLSSPKAATVAINGDTISVTGEKWTSTLVTVQYRDEQGNTVESTFKVTVHDPWAVAMIIGGLVLVGLALLGLIYLTYRQTFKIKGTLRVVEISEERRTEDGKTWEPVVIYPFEGIDYTAASVPAPKSGKYASWFSDTSTAETKNASVSDAEKNAEIQRAKIFSGDMDIRAAAGRKPSTLGKALTYFVNAYTKHMTEGGRSSSSAGDVKAKSGIWQTVMNDIRVSGSQFGKHGIVLHFPTKRDYDVVIGKTLLKKRKLKTGDKAEVIIEFTREFGDSIWKIKWKYRNGGRKR